MTPTPPGTKPKVLMGYWEWRRGNEGYITEDTMPCSSEMRDNHMVMKHRGWKLVKHWTELK